MDLQPCINVLTAPVLMSSVNLCELPIVKYQHINIQCPVLFNGVRAKALA